MPISQTCGGMRSRTGGVGERNRAASPTHVPMAKQIAESSNGGIEPDASVRSASSAHIATAEKPIRVARAMSSPWNAHRRAPQPASKRRAWMVIVPICVPTVAWMGAYMPVLPSGAKVTTMRLLVLRNSSALRPLR